MLLITSVILSVCVVAADTAEIPLENIWGYHRSLRELEPELFIKRDTPEKIAEYSTPEKLQEVRDKAASSLTYGIEKAMVQRTMNQNNSKSHNEWAPKPGFAVVGQGREALAGIHAVVVEGKAPLEEFKASDDLAIVFFALRVNGLRLFNATRTGNKISIRYGLIANGLMASHSHLSFIPSGRLPIGEYEVKYERAFVLEKEVQNDIRFKRFGSRTEYGHEKIICRDFVFKIVD